MRLLKEHSISQGLAEELIATVDDIERALFGEPKRISCLMAEADGEVAGFLIWFPAFSTFRGRATAHIEDCYVAGQYRRAVLQTSLCGMPRG